MAFRKTEAPVAPMDLTGADPLVVERRILDGVRRYATRAENWASADRNTPFLGHITGMGIESANLVDITMSMERQFLTHRTVRVPVAGDGSGFRLESGELGKLVILEGEDTTAATPGLAVKMLMDLGHMAQDDAYLVGVVSFACVVVVGEGHRLREALGKAVRRLANAGATARADAAANLAALRAQTERYVADVADPAAVAAAQREACESERREFERLAAQLRAVSDELESSRAGEETGDADKLRSRQVSLKLQLSAHTLRLKVAEEVARHPGRRSPVEEEKVVAVCALLESALAEAEVAAARAAVPAAT